MGELDRPSAEDSIGQTPYLLAGAYTILGYLVEDTHLHPNRLYSGVRSKEV